VIENDEDNLPLGLMIMRGNNTVEGANEASKDYKMMMDLFL
jgi:hypothetical protein